MQLLHLADDPLFIQLLFSFPFTLLLLRMHLINWRTLELHMLYIDMHLLTSSLSRALILFSYRLFCSLSSFCAISFATWMPCIISSLAFNRASSISASSLWRKSNEMKWKSNENQESQIWVPEVENLGLILTELSGLTAARFWQIQSLFDHLHCSNRTRASRSEPQRGGWTENSDLLQESHGLPKIK